jgi:hypothetical protein
MNFELLHESPASVLFLGGEFAKPVPHRRRAGVLANAAFDILSNASSSR